MPTRRQLAHLLKGKIPASAHSIRIKAGQAKYGNVKTTTGNLTFASKREAARYLVLHGMLLGGAISNLELQPRFPILIHNVRVFTYVADFAYTCCGKRVVEDSKGFLTAIYKLKRKCVKAYYGIEVVEV